MDLWTDIMYNDLYQFIQFGCGISKMVGPKKEDFWPKNNMLIGKNTVDE